MHDFPKVLQVQMYSQAFIHLHTYSTVLEAVPNLPDSKLDFL